MIILKQARISCDVRWQLENEPVDKRYFGEHVGLAKPKAGLYAKDDEKDETEKNDRVKTVQISDLKSKWGIDLTNEEGKRLNEKWGTLQRQTSIAAMNLNFFAYSMIVHRSKKF